MSKETKRPECNLEEHRNQRDMNRSTCQWCGRWLVD